MADFDPAIDLECAFDGCDKTFAPRGSGQKAKKYCSVRCGLKEPIRKYHTTQGYKDSRKKYRDSDAGKTAIKLYDNSPEGKATRVRHGATPNSIANHIRYRATPKGIASRLRYETSSLGRAKSTRASHKRRALKSDAFVEHVELQVLIQTQNNLCSLCGTDFVGVHPNPTSPTMEHTVPLSRGGEHSYANCTAAHLRCNIVKGVKCA